MRGLKVVLGEAKRRVRSHSTQLNNLKRKIIDSKVDAFFLESSIARSSIYQRNTIV